MDRGVARRQRLAFLPQKTAGLALRYARQSRQVLSGAYDDAGGISASIPQPTSRNEGSWRARGLGGETQAGGGDSGPLESGVILIV